MFTIRCEKNLALKWKSHVANSSCCSSLCHWTTNWYLPRQPRFFTGLRKHRWLTCFNNLVPRVLCNLCQHVSFPAADTRGAPLTCYAPFWPEMSDTSRLQPLPPFWSSFKDKKTISSHYKMSLFPAIIISFPLPEKITQLRFKIFSILFYTWFRLLAV